MAAPRAWVWAALLACAAAGAGAAPAHVLIIVDGAANWTALAAMLPPPDAALLMTPLAVGNGASPESASMASAMSTGCTSARRAVATAGVPLGKRARAAGLATAAVTNACLTDPTAAAFFGRAADRYNAAGLAAAVRAATLDIALMGASRVFTPANASGDACFPTTRAQLIAAARACPRNRTITGGFGDARSALAAECLHMPFAHELPPTLPTLADMTAAALARTSAAVPATGVFIVVAQDRMDHAVHRGNHVRSITILCYKLYYSKIILFN